MDKPRTPSGQPAGGQFTTSPKAASGLTLASPAEPAKALPVLSDHDARVLPEVDLTFHAADVEWAGYHRQQDTDLDSTEDPMYDTEGPWYGEGEDLQTELPQLTPRRAA
ncbi:hypothetical protein [Pseudactinotalea sp. Z1748]|uniref:hypothetical protein n=1 Tax=Pseudactinotalea sp. Z1748 TaxID=3413027 RepID=UPI003C7C04A1